jgi:putative intracellular protease/amidase
MDTPITISDRHLTIGALIFLSAGRLVFSVHTGALLWGAAGALRGRQATTHWAVWNLMPYHGPYQFGRVSSLTATWSIIECMASVTGG